MRGAFEQARERGWGELSAHAVVRPIEERAWVVLGSAGAAAGSDAAAE